MKKRVAQEEKAPEHKSRGLSRDGKMKIRFLADKGSVKKGHVDFYPEHRAKRLIEDKIAELVK